MNAIYNDRNGALPLPTGKTVLLHEVLLRHLNKEVTDKLLRSVKFKAIPKDTFLFMEGNEHESVFFIIKGRIKEIYTTSQGEEILRNISEPGYFVSLHPALCENCLCSWSGLALNNVEYLCWDRETFAQFIRDFSEFSLRIAIILGNYMENSCRKVCLNRKPNSLCRAAGYILSKSMEQHGCPFMRFEDRDNARLHINIAPISLAANEICLARETFSRAISKLQKKGILDNRNGKIEILDLNALKEIVGLNT